MKPFTPPAEPLTASDHMRRACELAVLALYAGSPADRQYIQGLARKHAMLSEDASS